MKKFLVIFAVLLLLTSPTWAAGSSMTFSILPDVGSVSNPSNYSVLTISWISDSATGSVSASTSTSVNNAIKGKKLLYVVTKPGSPAPTDSYDISITTSDGNVLTGGALLDRSSTNVESTIPYNGAIYDSVVILDTITITVLNAGNSKQGIIKLVLSK